MAGVGPAQELLVREIRHARGGHELAAGTGPLDQGGVRPTQKPPGIIGERGGRGERRPDERCTPPGPQAVPDDIADDQHGGIPRPFGDQVEVAADLLGGGQERRGQLQAGALGQLGRGERIPDRTQILQLMLGQLKTLMQRRDLLVAHVGLSAKARDQRLLAVVPRTHVADVALPAVRFGVQPPKLCVVFFALLAHGADGRASANHNACLSASSRPAPHGPGDAPPPPPGPLRGEEERGGVERKGKKAQRPGTTVAIAFGLGESRRLPMPGTSSIRALLRPVSERLAVNQERLQRAEQPFGTA